MTRLRRLIATALVDSFGLSLGWTVFSLHVVRGHGLAGLGLCNAAMLVGVALSAPVASRLSARLDGRALLRVTCVTESVLRVGAFAVLLTGAPLLLVAVAVAASNVVAWTGYAGMRAFGSAAAVALASRVIAANGVGALSIALVTVLAATVVVTLARHRNHWALHGTGAATNPG
jgi:MFS family permease